MSLNTPAPRNSDGKDFGLSAIAMYEQKYYPPHFRFVPVHGKATYVQDWATQALDHDALVKLYKENSAYRGLGVVTGGMSGGLLAIDVDGPQADARLKAAIGKDNYEAYGEESTMSWTSGKPGRRQLLYMVPAAYIPELKHITTIILDEDSDQWVAAGGDNSKEARDKELKQKAKEGKYEELVIRFNHCQSVLPGSPHPQTHKLYYFLNYNHGKVEDAPEWLLDILRDFRKPVQWLTESEQRELDAEYGETILPSSQIRGWFFKDEVQQLLMPRLEELVFRHAVFDQYGWKDRGGRKPQRMNGCPWHESNSGTAFQYNVHTGCWDCKACKVGGDVLDFIHKIKKNDKHAPRPMGPDLESYVAELAGKLGYDYPSCANKKDVNSTLVPRLDLTSKEFHERLIEIYEKVKNPAEMLDQMARLAADSGRRLSGTQCLAAMDNYRYYKIADEKNHNTEWWKNLERSSFIIPNLLKKPTQVILHAAGGLGKTSACMGLARAIGMGLTTKIRGIDLPVERGKVLWIQNDQNQIKLLDDMEDNGIDPDKDSWFVVRRHFQMDHTHRLREWIKEIKPALVVIDSIGSCSTKMQVEEKDKAFANPLYWAAEANGDLENGFPACSIIWIHHDNAQGGVRGTRYLVNAVDEQWHLRGITDAEREHLRTRGHNPSSCRVIEIKKSRMGRQGDNLVVERDQDFRFSVWDLTPTERREDDGQGEPDPMTTALRIVRDRVKEVTEDTYLGDLQPWMTAQEVWESLHAEVTGLGGKPPSSKTVKRWLDRWVRDGVLTNTTVPRQGAGRPFIGYTIPSLSRVRCPSVVFNSPKSPENDCAARDLIKDTPDGVLNSPEPVDPPLEHSGTGHPEPETNKRHEAPATESVLNSEPPENDCAAGDLSDPARNYGQRTAHSHTSRATPEDGQAAPPAAPWLDPVWIAEALQEARARSEEKDQES